MKTVEVCWIDAWHTSAESTLEEAQNLEPIKRRSVGYLLKQTDSVVVVAMGNIGKVQDGQESFCDKDIIPMGIVTSMSVLEDD